MWPSPSKTGNSGRPTAFGFDDRGHGWSEALAASHWCGCDSLRGCREDSFVVVLGGHTRAGHHENLQKTKFWHVLTLKSKKLCFFWGWKGLFCYGFWGFGCAVYGSGGVGVKDGPCRSFWASSCVQQGILSVPCPSQRVGCWARCGTVAMKLQVPRLKRQDLEKNCALLKKGLKPGKTRCFPNERIQNDEDRQKPLFSWSSGTWGALLEVMKLQKKPTDT